MYAHDWFDAIMAHNPEEATTIINTLGSNEQERWVVNSVIELYMRQNDAIGDYANARGISHLSLADIERAWIDDPDGEAKFFDNYRINHPEEWERLCSNADFYSFLVFQACWIFNPTHMYLVSMSHGGRYVDADMYSDKDALERLRARFKPFSRGFLA
jgi:hypothetical protein